MRQILKVLTLALFAFAFLAGAALAQEDPEEIARKYGITFPISELGNCGSYSECRSYCEDPVNYDECIDFAKKKGIYQEESIKLDIRNSEFWQRTESELGCNSFDSCRQVCENPDNFDSCNRFAKRNDLTGGHVANPHEEEFLRKAEEILGCNSASSCMSFCEKEQNWKKCSEFAKSIGLIGGEEFVGPGGCNSEQTCSVFCSDPANFEICRQFSSAHGGGDFQGPGGCTDEASCRKYCEESPDRCSFVDEGSNYSHEEWCNKTPDCAWTGNSCQCTKVEGLTPDEYCQKYPDRCGYQGNPQEECSKYPGCSWQNNTCQCSSTTGSYSGYDPATECSKYPSCSWNGSSCECSESSGSGYSYPTGSYDPATECTKQSGCSWTGSTCQCSGSGESYSPPPSEPYPTSGVYGAAVVRSLFQAILQYLFGSN